MFDEKKSLFFKNAVLFSFNENIFIKCTRLYGYILQ